MQYVAALFLLAAHALLVAIASEIPESIASVLAATVYGPLWPLHSLRIPVYGASPGWGWSSPNVLGWSFLALFWGSIWLVVVSFVVRLTRRGQGSKAVASPGPHTTISTASPTPAVQLAVCRETQTDGHDWSIYAVNNAAESVSVCVLRGQSEWGDASHTFEPRNVVTLPPGAAEQILRVNDDDAEMALSLSLRVESPSGQHVVIYELGKLYRYRDPIMLSAPRKTGWLRSATIVTPP